MASHYFHSGGIDVIMDENGHEYSFTPEAYSFQLCSTIAVILSLLDLPEIPTEIHPQDSWETNENGGKLGIFGEMMIKMLPHDLPFTVFVPSDRAFEHILRLRPNHSFTPEEWDNKYATVSRVLGFSTVPRKIYASSVPIGEERSFDSISGLRLHISKDLDGVLVVNRVRSEVVDIRKGEVVVHVNDGILMDTEFDRAVRPHDDEEERRWKSASF
ncbi:hypothetical protein Cgig2_032705 [Carnegiea gigantea]|uniref:FAS1 domain-containing protein n=1 Tax=Carnegiea gigantea TaxID=171969 RepID=A0A9Q1QJJ9_9CARY|nr:hypothetical protein Cgig2_032705 [Carnegiea gigantea]